jgi:ubiquinone biosynthesis monooxygenase Coq6
MLSATDKLHKLYSSTLPPVVWARSVGVEVLNELDTVKAAIMMNAGSHVSKHGAERPDASMWNVAAGGFEFASGVSSTAKTIGSALGSVASSKLNEVLNTYTRR